MKITLMGKDSFIVTDEMQEWAQGKFDKLDKFFKDDVSAVINLFETRNAMHAEATITSNGMLFRAKTEHDDILVAIDKLERAFGRQIAKNKTRLSKHLREGAAKNFTIETVDDDFQEEEKEFKIVKNKRFNIKPMSVEEAILQMNLLGHQFFIFRDAEDMQTSLVYVRKDGNYGLIVI